jgi:CRP-like cAMP-binding protein
LFDTKTYAAHGKMESTVRSLQYVARGPERDLFLPRKVSAVAKQAIPAEQQRKGIHNKILLAIPDREFSLIGPCLEQVTLESHASLHEPHDVYRYAYFPIQGLISLVVTMKNGKTVEAGIVGREGVAGLPAMAGINRSPLREIVQISGEAFRVRTGTLQSALDRMPEFDRILKRYTVVLGLQLAQTAACNRLHDVERRLARWLLMAQDRVNFNVLPVTHEFLATMLGTDRPSVTLAAGVFQRREMIRYSRGAVKILNREQLESAACECYGVIQRYADAGWAAY